MSFKATWRAFIAVWTFSMLLTFLDNSDLYPSSAQALTEGQFDDVYACKKSPLFKALDPYFSLWMAFGLNFGVPTNTGPSGVSKVLLNHGGIAISACFGVNTKLSKDSTHPKNCDSPDYNVLLTFVLLIYT